MALSLGVRVGSKILVGKQVVTVKSIAATGHVVLQVGNQEFVISEEERKEILPQVHVFSFESNRLAFEAPTSIRIQRVREEKNEEPKSSLKLSEKVQRVLQGEGIQPKEMSYMVANSAITSTEGFNRRFHHWLFLLQEGAVQDMRTVKRLVVGQGNSSQSEQHDSCNGSGCKKCGWSGEIIRRITDKSLPVYQPLQLR